MVAQQSVLFYFIIIIFFYSHFEGQNANENTDCDPETAVLGWNGDRGKKIGHCHLTGGKGGAASLTSIK